MNAVTRLGLGGFPRRNFFEAPINFKSQVFATDFNPTPIVDRYSRGGNFTGLVAHPDGILSFWIKIRSSPPGTQNILISGPLGRVLFRRFGSDLIRVVLVAPSPGGTLLAHNSATALRVGEWDHVLMAWRAGGQFHAYFNGVLDANSPASVFAGSVDYPEAVSANWQIGASTTNLLPLDACLSEVWFGPTLWADITQQSVRDKFAAFSGPGYHPVDLANDGSAPLGVQPSLYLRDPVATFGTNYGTGGNLSPVGDPTACADAPPVVPPAPAFANRLRGGMVNANRCMNP